MNAEVPRSPSIPARGRPRAVRLIWVGLGFVSLTIGFVGMVVPIIPTTPLVILAAACFSRGSGTLHRWLHNQRWVGPALCQWEANGVIRTRAKVMATLLIGIAGGLTVYRFGIGSAVPVAVFLVLGGVLVFIWTRPAKVRQPVTADAST